MLIEVIIIHWFLNIIHSQIFLSILVCKLSSAAAMSIHMGDLELDFRFSSLIVLIAVNNSRTVEFLELLTLANFSQNLIIFNLQELFRRLPTSWSITMLGYILNFWNQATDVLIVEISHRNISLRNKFSKNSDPKFHWKHQAELKFIERSAYIYISI
jgi:hypothetical protein